MNVKTIGAIGLLLALSSTAFGQLSAYGSVSYGYHANPLFNYAAVHDRTFQTYTELNYATTNETSRLQAAYVSGLVLFNTLAERNYYEHSLAGSYRHLFGEPAVNDDGESAWPEHPKHYFDLGLKGSARHDRSAFSEFDNYGAEANAAYRWSVRTASGFLLSNRLGYRTYVNLPELSNIADEVSLRFESGEEKGLSYALFAGAGMKRFTVKVTDTLTFTDPATGNNGNGNGNGKGKGAGLGTGQGGGRTTRLLTNSTSGGTYQLSAGAALRNGWETGSVEAQFLYRIDPDGETRYLAQATSGSMLTEDIYNDHFSYQGPELHAAFMQQLPGGIRSSLGVHLQSKLFGAPALSLTGESVGNKRKDIYADAEVILVKPFPLFDDLTLELSLTAGALRNQSNDAYSDFSSTSIMMGLGLGF